MAMVWHDLLFMHWPVAPELLRPFIPPGLELETHGGSAWLGIVPFRMTGIRARFLPAVPRLSAFPELNVRTYVTAPSADGPRPGVWFISLDAPKAVAVAVARRSYHLAYMNARMRCAPDGEWIEYRSVRTGPNLTHAFGPTHARHAEFAGRYRPTAAPAAAARGTLDEFLTERYCLYAYSRAGRLYRAEIDHGPWPLQPAAAEIRTNTMTLPLGIEPGALSGPPLLHFARRLDVVAWLPGRV